MAKLTNAEVARLTEKQRKQAKSGLSDQYNNTDSCQSFYNGDQMTYTDRIQFATSDGARKRAQVTFNKVQPPVDAIVGFMAQNRREAKFMARQTASPQQNLYSKNMNALYGYHRERTNAPQLETDQDADMVINGYGAIDTDLSYIIGNATTDPNGQILKSRINPKHFYWDPAARAKNLLDARFMGYHDDYDLKDALDLFQGSTEEDFEKVAASDEGDQGYVYNPYGGLYDKIKEEDSAEWADNEKTKVRVYNHQWMQYETVYKAENPVYLMDNQEDAQFILMKLEAIAEDINNYSIEDLKTRDAFDFDPLAQQLFMDESTKKKMVAEFGTLIEPVAFKRKCYYTAVVSGKHVFNWFKSVSQSGFSIKVKTGIYSEQFKIWTGMVNAMMEPTKYYNKALTEWMFTIAANSKGGVFVEQGAVEDIDDFEKKYAKTDAVVVVNEGAISGQKIQQKTTGAVPNGLDSILTLADQSITLNGVDPAMVGQIDNEDQSGILFKRRIRQIQSRFARYMDSGTLYQREDAILCEDLIRVWVENNDGQWVRITGEDGADDFVQISKDMLATSYDVSVQETPLNPEDKQEQAIMLTGYGDKLAALNPQGALTFYSESLQLLPLDGDVRNRLLEALKPQQSVPMEQFQALQAQLQELQSQLNMAQVAKLASETELNKAKIQQTHADSIKKMEEANEINIEAGLAKSGQVDKTSVFI